MGIKNHIHTPSLTGGLGRVLLRTLFPPLCLCCGNRLLRGEEYVCTECMMQLPRTMLGTDVTDNIFVRRFWGTLPIVGGTAVFVYHPGSELTNIIHKMKYGNRPTLCRFMGKVMAHHAMTRQLLSTADALVPVPITQYRQRERGYNQSELLCQGISAVTSTPIITDALVRTRFDISQTALSHEERRENIRNAFTLHNADALQGKHIVLVDDIVTTGSTTIECLFTLSQVPNIHLSILALAWTGGEW